MTPIVGKLYKYLDEVSALCEQCMVQSSEADTRIMLMAKTSLAQIPDRETLALLFQPFLPVPVQVIIE